MTNQKLTVYLDKGAIGAFDLLKGSKDYQICYSEATLFDLLNDHTESCYKELKQLTGADARYLYKRDGEVSYEHGNAATFMSKLNTIEIDAMAKVYQFLNGGGQSNFLDVFKHQISTFLNTEIETQDQSDRVINAIVAHEGFLPLKDQTPNNWYRELQRATKTWSQDKRATLRTVFAQDPDMARGLEPFFPQSIPDPEKIQLAALMLGILQLGSDKGITSPNELVSEKAAINGYVDCMHIMFGLTCDVFITTDKATRRRFDILNEFWNCNRISALLERKTK